MRTQAVPFAIAVKVRSFTDKAILSCLALSLGDLVQDGIDGVSCVG